MNLTKRRRNIRLRNRFLRAVELLLYPIRFCAAFGVLLIAYIRQEQGD